MRSNQLSYTPKFYALPEPTEVFGILNRDLLVFSNSQCRLKSSTDGVYQSRSSLAEVEALRQPFASPRDLHDTTNRTPSNRRIPASPATPADQAQGPGDRCGRPTMAIEGVFVKGLSEC